MKLSKNSFHRTFYILTFGKEPGNNFCDYFWKQLMGVIFFVVTWPSYVISALASIPQKEKYLETKITNENGKVVLENFHREMTFMEKYKYYCASFGLKMAIGFAVQGFILLLAFSLYKDYKSTLIGIGFVIGFFTVLGFISWFSENISELGAVKAVKKESYEIGQVVKTGFKSFKDKNCPIIVWDDVPSEAGK